MTSRPRPDPQNRLPRLCRDTPSEVEEALERLKTLQLEALHRHQQLEVARRRLWKGCEGAKASKPRWRGWDQFLRLLGLPGRLRDGRPVG